MRPELSEEIQRFEEKYAENPDSLVFARLADLYRKAGEADRALDVLDDGLRRHPDYLSAHIVRARCLRDLGRGEEAERAFEHVLEQDDQNLVAVRELAELARERGDAEEAERRYEELLALDPHNDEARSYLDEGAARGAPGGETAGSDPGEATAARAQAAGGDDAAGSRSDAPGGSPVEGATRTADADEAGSRRAADRDVGQRTAGGPEAGPPAGDEAVEGDAVEHREPEDGAAEAGPTEEEYDDGPWWRTDAPAGEPDDAAEPPGAPDDREEEPRSRGAGQSDVFRLAEPEDADQPGAGPEPASEEEAEFLGLDEGTASGTPGTDGAADGGLPAEDELGDRIREIADTEGGPEEAGGEDEEDLLTETLADLYETQGFYREAVEMYEELLEDRPDDEELRARLQAARSAMEDPAGPDDRPGGDAGAGTGSEEAVPGGAEGEGPAWGGSAEEEPRESRGRPAAVEVDGAEAVGPDGAAPVDVAAGPPEGADTPEGDPGPVDDEGASAPERSESARAHLRALLRGDARRLDGPPPDGADPRP